MPPSYNSDLNLDHYPDASALAVRSGNEPPATASPNRTPRVVGSPEWWLERLLPRLKKQASYCKTRWAFYDGDQPLAFASEKFETVYGERYRALPANFMPLVIRAEQERLVVQGFRFGTAVDEAAWKIWQRNNMDAESQIAHEIALAKGAAFVMVAPQPGAPAPLLTVEDPDEVVIETQPGNKRVRLAALKSWVGEDGFRYANVYLPDEVYKYRSHTKPTAVWSGDIWTNADAWDRWEVPGEPWPLPNPLGDVPIVPLLNLPTRDGAGRSELEPIIGNQNAINFLRFSALIGSDHAALPQRWALNLDLQVDEDTGQVKVPFRNGIDNLWTSRRPTAAEAAEYGDQYPQTSFGQFPAADMRPFTELIAQEVSQMSSISRTPYHYLLGTPQSVPPTGESIKSSEAPLVKKVQTASVHLGDGWEEVMRLSLKASGQAGKARADAETIWADPETRNEGARTDSIIKQYQVGLLPPEVALEELGYSPQTVKRIMELRTTEAAANAEAAAVAALTAPQQGTGAPGLPPTNPAQISAASNEGG